MRAFLDLLFDPGSLFIVNLEVQSCRVLHVKIASLLSNNCSLLLVAQ